MRIPLRERVGAARGDAMTNELHFGDNLDVLRAMPPQSIDLIYLDPPFNSNATYNVLYGTRRGGPSQAQSHTFEDTWTWDHAARRALEQTAQRHLKAGALLDAFAAVFPESNMLAYLAMMAVRLIEMQRVLKETGAIYLHCDPTASHYIKILLDVIFGKEQFINEIVWKRTSGKSDHAQGATHWPRLHDVIFYYRKGPHEGGTLQATFARYDDNYVASKYPHTDAEGRRYGLWDMTGPGGAAKGNPSYEVLGVVRFWRFSKERMQALLDEGRVIQPRPGAVPRYKRYFDEMPGVVVGDVWDDLSPINSQAKERLGYSTQSPLNC